MIVVDGISKSYSSQIFKDFSKIFENGKLYVITGPNASGKSTLLHALAGAIRIENGNIEIDNIPETNHIEYRKKISIHFSDLNLFTTLNPKQFWDFHFKIYDENISLQDILVMAHEFKLIDQNYFIEKPLYTLSSGTRRKIFLIASLLRKADVYLFDEPDSNLDIESQKTLIRHLVKILENDATIIIVSHSISFLQQLQTLDIPMEHIPWQIGMTSLERVGY